MGFILNDRKYLKTIESHPALLSVIAMQRNINPLDIIRDES